MNLRVGSMDLGAHLRAGQAKQAPLDLDAIKREHSLKPVAEGAGVKLKRAGSEWKGCCPFHSEKTPSFTIYADGKRWHCFGCQKSGDVLDFVQEAQGLSNLHEAAQWLCNGNAPRQAVVPPIKSEPAREHAVRLRAGQKIVASFNYCGTTGELI